MNLLDVRLLGFLGFASALMLAVGMRLVYRVMPQSAAIRFWSSGAICSALAFASGYLREQLPLPPVFSIVALNALGVLGVALMYRGVREALRLPEGFNWARWMTLWAVAYALLLTLLVPSVPGRMVCFCLSIGALHGLNAWVSIRSVQARSDVNRRTWLVLGWFHAAAALVLLIQAASAPMLPEVNGLSQMTQPTHLLGFAMIFINNISQTFGLMYVIISRRERALREGEKRYRDLVDQTPDGIFLMDAQGHFLSINPAGAAMLGLPDEGGRNITLQQVLVAEDRLPAERAIAQCLYGQVLRQEWRFCRLDGSVFPGEVLSRRLHDGRLQGIFKDISEQKAVQAALERARDLAESGNRAKSAFLANMSHEIRTPMNAIMGFTNILKMDVDDDQHLDYLNKITKASRHLLDIINDILDLSKIDAGELRLEKIPTDVRQIGQHIQALLSEELEKKGLQWSFECDPRVPVQLIGDPTRLTQAWLNLVSNAVKFTPQGQVKTQVTLLETQAQGVLLRFDVHDSGIGMNEAVQARLFAPFHQADDSLTRLHGGTGLGLTITRRLAELMDGAAGVHSREGEGSHFWFTARLQVGLPEPTLLDVRRTVEFTQAYLDDLRRSVGGARVLLVEDDALSQDMARIMLENLNLHVDLAADGQDAFDKIVVQGTQPTYDLVLMDIQMMRMDGFEATQRIRELPGWRVVPIVAMTANTFVEDQRRALDAGMNDFVAKPVQAERLYSVLRKWVRSPKA